MSDSKIFKGAGEASVSKAIVTEYTKLLTDSITSDAIIIGAGPSGLTAACELAKKGKKVTVVEANNYLGGGYWIGGYFMNKVTYRAPSHELLKELGVETKDCGDGVWVADAPWACSALIAHAYKCGAKVLNMTAAEDLVVKSGRVAGVVINWSAKGSLPKQITCLDPIALEAKVVIDSTGHEAVAINKLAKRGIVEFKGENTMNIEASEEDVVKYTGEVYPGLYATGMAVASYHGLHRMGPTFGSMLYSGKKVAEMILGKEF